MVISAIPSLAFHHEHLPRIIPPCMLLRPIAPEEKDQYNRVVTHPNQSWEWGEFRRASGLKLERVGFYEHGKLQKALELTFHPIPLIGMTAGYFPKGFMPDEEQLAALKQLGKQHNALFIKMEPNVAQKVGTPSGHYDIAQFLQKSGVQPGKPMFHRYTFYIDLTKSEDELFNNIANKTRYNINLASKKGVQIIENSSDEGMEEYINILEETTKRQGFYAHSPEYFRNMWQALGPSGWMRIFQAVYEGQVLVSWVMFIFNGKLYYPYGASRAIHRDVMASNLMMWEMIRFGKSMGCHTFDLWGCLGPDANPKDPWFGFHRFKKGYGGDLMEFLGSYDLVLNQPLYKIFQVVDTLRWKVLKLKAKLRV
jgi:lipid II:glycine glycyltransferase (peptidoglycan interpeptide bridge formation enzyme)